MGADWTVSFQPTAHYQNFVTRRFPAKPGGLFAQGCHQCVTAFVRIYPTERQVWRKCPLFTAVTTNLEKLRFESRMQGNYCFFALPDPDPQHPRSAMFGKQPTLSRVRVKRSILAATAPVARQMECQVLDPPLRPGTKE